MNPTTLMANRFHSTFSVISTYEEPIPGWCNNVYGINGMVVGTGLGFIKVSPCKSKSKNDVVCADFVTNGTLAAIWGKAEEKYLELHKITQKVLFLNT